MQQHDHAEWLGTTEMNSDGLSDTEIVDRVRGGDIAAYELLMRRYNQRLFRTARSILRNDHEAEDVVQEAYVRAYEHLSRFRGDAMFATWLTKIAMHEALARRKKQSRLQLFRAEASVVLFMRQNEMLDDPTKNARRGELNRMLADLIDSLPDDLRVVFTLRLVEGLGTRETADCLGLSASNVKTRLHRARARLRAQIDQQIGKEVRLVYQFDGARCDRVVTRVMNRLARNPTESEGNRPSRSAWHEDPP